MVSDFFMDDIFKSTVETPIGNLNITTNRNFLLSISFSIDKIASEGYQPDIMAETVRQLEEYFNGKRKEFNLNLHPAGTDFQYKVWEQVEQIPFGKTASYLDIAKETGSKNNTRAVGLANGKNPIPIVIPCHRVIGSNGKLTGYAGGLDRKKWLLQHELKYSRPSNLLF